MKASLVSGAIIAILALVSVFEAGMILSNNDHGRHQSFTAVVMHLHGLAKDEREQIRADHDAQRQKLREEMRQIRAENRDLAAYLSSPNYNRAEAEARFAQIKQNTDEVMSETQAMALDLADHLPPEKRAAVFGKMARSEP